MRILIVEDEALLALELESELEDAGHEVVGQAKSAPEAYAALEHDKPDFAFVDINLIDGPTGVDIGRRLTDDGVPFVFVTGNIRRIPDDFAGAIGAIEKPYTVNGLQNALTYIGKLIEGARPPLAPPSLLLANM